MATEIERKFLLIDESWRDGADAGLDIAQGYLSQDPDRSVRVRIAGGKAWLTVKGRSEGISRAEFEYEVPPADARQMLELCLPSVIEKTRHRVLWGGHVWEIDVFHGQNDGLIVAEVELTDDSVVPALPPWAGREVSEDARYFNSCLATHPYCKWAR